MDLLDNLIKQGWLKTPRIIEAFKAIKRADFLMNDVKDLAGINEALPIGYGQTISQPLVVAFMLELLSPQEGDKVLDIGSGSGWTSALLGEIVSRKGKVVALEVIPDLAKFGWHNVAKYNFIEEGRVRFVCADGTKGYLEEAPFNRILCSAAVQDKVPEAWKKQLKVGGRIVTPITSSIWLLKKQAENKFVSKEYPGFAFVPLVRNNPTNKTGTSF